MDESQSIMVAVCKATPGLAFVALVKVLCECEQHEVIQGIDIQADPDGLPFFHASVILHG